MVDRLDLASGLTIQAPLDRLRRFCREEYLYYDAVTDVDPDRIDPLDVIVTTAVNAFSTASARRMRDIHRGLKERAEPLLAAVPRDTPLPDAAEDTIGAVRRLLDASVEVPGVLLAVATKVLHRKRPALIPMMDSVVVGHYRRVTGEKWLVAAWDGGPRVGEAGVAVMRLLRSDLVAARPQLERIVSELAADGYPLTPLRVLEMLLWTEVEPQGNYRDTPGAVTTPATTVPATSEAGRAAVSPVEARLRTWAAGFAREHTLPSRELRVEPPLHADETDGLALALSAGLVTVDSGGGFRVAGAIGSKGPYHLFSRGERPTLNREYLIQIAAFAELVHDHGWPAASVAFEHDALDLVTFNVAGQAVLAVEAKRDEKLLDRMLEEMTSVASAPFEAAATNATRKTASLARLRPTAFWAVAPGARRVFDVVYDADVPRLIPREQIPAGPRGPYACRICGSEDEVRGEPEKNGIICLRCDACGYRWSRVPRRPCPRCGSADVEVSGYQGWAYEDLDAACAAEWRDAEWHCVDWDVYRCRQCRNVWQVGHRST